MRRTWGRVEGGGGGGGGGGRAPLVGLIEEEGVLFETKTTRLSLPTAAAAARLITSLVGVAAKVAANIHIS